MASYKASRVGMLVGALLCAALILISELVLKTPVLALAAWMVYFSMQGSANIVLFKHLKTRKKLIYGVVEIIFAVAFVVAIVYFKIFFKNVLTKLFYCGMI